MTHRIEGPNEQIIVEVKQAIAESNKDTARLDWLILSCAKQTGWNWTRAIIDKAMEAEK